MKKPLKLPKFKNEDAEREFWSKIELTDYFDASDLAPVSFPNLKPTSTSISVRIPNYILAELKSQANSLNIPYQTLMKQYIARGALQKE
jgi:predicted DNA binding CopG/RHH family protein